MLKFIVILVLLIYILNKVSVFLFRVVGHGRQAPPRFRGPGNNIQTEEPKKGKKNGLKGGEYVDYEEIK